MTSDVLRSFNYIMLNNYNIDITCYQQLCLYVFTEIRSMIEILLLNLLSLLLYSFICPHLLIYSEQCQLCKLE